jgi:hypothetical protein
MDISAENTLYYTTLARPTTLIANVLNKVQFRL